VTIVLNGSPSRITSSPVSTCGAAVIGWFMRAVQSVGIQAVTPHDLRHTCASLAVSAGVNVLALQRMLGHTSAKMTLDTYSDLFDDDLDAVAVTLHTRYSRRSVGNSWARAANDTSDQALKTPQPARKTEDSECGRTCVSSRHR
jgi:hypothetical protein